MGNKEPIQQEEKDMTDQDKFIEQYRELAKKAMEPDKDVFKKTGIRRPKMCGNCLGRGKFSASCFGLNFKVDCQQCDGLGYIFGA